MAALGQPQVMARTFHSHAVRQLRHFWPSRHAGEDPPQTLDTKTPLLRPLLASLPGHYRFTPSRDIAEAIEWAKVRRIPPTSWEAEGAGSGAHSGGPVRARLRRLRARQGALRPG